MRSMKRQSGLSFIGWLLVIGFAAFLTVAALRLVPVYLEYFTVANVLDSVAKEDGIGRKSKRVVWSKIEKRLDINEVDSVVFEDFEIVVDNSGTTFTISYERRTKLMGNLDGVAVFEKSVKAN